MAGGARILSNPLRLRKAGKTQQSGEFGSELRGLRIDAVPSTQDKSRLNSAHDACERSGGSQDIGPGKSAIAEMYCTVCAECQTVLECRARRRGAERNDDHLGSLARVPQLNSEVNSAHIEGIDFEWNPLTQKPFSHRVDAKIGDVGDLFNANEYAHFRFSLLWVRDWLRLREF
jgi:hypothetical protein